MEQKPKRKGTPQHPLRKVGLIIAATIILSVFILVIVLNFNNSSENERIHIPSVGGAYAVRAAELMHNPEIESDVLAANFITLNMLHTEDNHYLCLEVLPIALIEVNLAALHIHVNGQSIPYHVLPEGAPMNCLLLDATFERGWHIFDVAILDASTYEAVAVYRWGTEIR